MKRLLLIVLPLLLIVGCSSPEPINYETTLVERDGVYYTQDTNQPYSGPVFSLDGKGRNKRESILEDGKMITYKDLEWYENGQKKVEQTYKNGERDGLLLEWYEDGQKKVEQTYKNGERDGLVTVWYENGQKREKGTSKNDKLDGLYTRWYENGQKEIEETHKDGKVVELIGRWNEDGIVRKEPFDWE